MTIRGQSNIAEYFSDTLITLSKEEKKSANDGKTNKSKKITYEYKSKVAMLDKTKESGLLFAFDDNSKQVLKGFTIDLRMFYNLIRKIIIVKLNSDKIWTRQFYSQDLSKIFVILKPLDSVIENRALVMVV